MLTRMQEYTHTDTLVETAENANLFKFFIERYENPLALVFNRGIIAFVKDWISARS